MIEESNRDLENFSDMVSIEKSMRKRNEWRKLSLKSAKLKDLSLETNVFQRKLGLGPCYLGKFKGFNVRVRQVAMENVSDFMLRKIPDEVKFWKEAEEVYIEHYIGFIQEDKNLFLVAETEPNLIPLDQFLIQKGRKLGPKPRVRILSLVARVMMNLQKLGPGYVHGHLCPKNILVRRNLKFQVDAEATIVKIVDFGFVFLKKYCSFLNGYTNKDNFSCPEQLKEKGVVIAKISESSDIWSFGLICWYLETGMEPMEGLDLENIKKVIFEDRSRPKIPDDCIDEIGQIIRMCLKEDPKKRPRFEDILSFLARISVGKTPIEN